MANTFQARDMSGVLFRNDKDGNEKRPDYRGDITIGGVTYSLSSWIKEGSKGKYMSLSVQEKKAPESAPASNPAPSTRNGAAFDDECPFAAMDWRV